MANYPEEIGLIIDPKYFGSIGAAGNSSFYSGGHTLTHEMGHFFGLKHIWGQGTGEDCNDSDEIEDTPNAAGPYYDCPQGVQESCGTSDMYQNFMDFTDDRCLAAFTHDQVMMMQTTAAVFILIWMWKVHVPFIQILLIDGTINLSGRMIRHPEPM